MATRGRTLTSAAQPVDLNSTLTPGIIILALGFTCVFCPAFILRAEYGDPQTRARRKCSRFWSAMLGGLPMVAVLSWESLGIPPSHGSWLSHLLFWLAIVTPFAAIAPDWALCRPQRLPLALIGIAYCVLILAQVLAPPWYTLSAIHAYDNAITLAPKRDSEPCADPAVQPVFAHISDLHITNEKTTRDGRTPGNRNLAALIQRINEYRPPFLLISGDVTDKGTPEQWRLVDTLLRESKLNAQTKIIIGTGNHDLNYFFGRDPDEFSWFERPGRGYDAEPRIFRAVDFQSQYFAGVRIATGEIVGDVVSNQPTAANLQNFKREIAECVNACEDNAPFDQSAKLVFSGCRGLCPYDVKSIRLHYFKDIARSFPLYYFDPATQTAFISMTTSIAESVEVGRNAVGLIGKEQITNLQAVLSQLPVATRLIVVVQHHPPLWSGVPAPPPLKWADILHPVRTWDRVYSSPWFLAVFLHNDIEEGKRVYNIVQAELAKRPGASVIFAFGHRHERSLRSLDASILEEAPNLASTTPGDYGFYLVGVKESQVHIAWCEIPR